MASLPRPVEPYMALAAGYDLVMRHVDYGAWAGYVLRLLAEHAPGASSVIELGCGTGSLALELQARARRSVGPGGFDYLATDGSARMVEVARAKAAAAGARAGRLRFEVADFLSIRAEQRFDAALLLYDGLNYLLEEAEVRQLLATIDRLLGPGGVALIDQSTPANSLNNAACFEDEATASAFAYVRRSHYDASLRHHITEFDILLEGQRFVETHVQRAYTLDEIERLIRESPLSVVAAYDGFSTEPASGASERVHWVLQREAGRREGEAPTP